MLKSEKKNKKKSIDIYTSFKILSCQNRGKEKKRKKIEKSIGFQIFHEKERKKEKKGKKVRRTYPSIGYIPGNVN